MRLIRERLAVSCVGDGTAPGDRGSVRKSGEAGSGSRVPGDGTGAPIMKMMILIMIIIIIILMIVIIIIIVINSNSQSFKQKRIESMYDNLSGARGPRGCLRGGRGAGAPRRQQCGNMNDMIIDNDININSSTRLIMLILI